MNILGSILSKLGIGKAEAAAVPAAETSAAPPVSVVDVLAKLEGLAAAQAEPLN